MLGGGRRRKLKRGGPDFWRGAIRKRSRGFLGINKVPQGWHNGIKSGEGKKKFNLCVFSSVHVEG